jgi:hypothetical protein
VVIGMVLLLLLPPLLFCVHFYDAVSRQLSILPIALQILSIPVSSASLTISPHAGPVNPQHNNTSFASFGSGNWKFELICLFACLLGRSRSIIILERCRDGGAVAGWG